MAFKYIRNMMTTLMCCSWLISVSHANEGDKERAQKIVEVWKVWTQESSVSGSSIAVSFKGNLITTGEKERSAKEPYPVASLSKAITGICITKLVSLGKLKYATKLSEIIPSLDVSATIGELLTHTSGFTKDVTQSSLQWIKNRGEENLEIVVARQISKDRPKKNTGYSYNNSNFAMLGLAIKTITGKSYEAACNELVLEPIGVVSATLNPPWRLMSSWGGWKISAVDYLKFVDAYFFNEGVVGIKPTELPNVEFPGGAHYGIGNLFRIGQFGGYHYWHMGAWDWRGKPKKEKFSAYFAKWANGWAVSVNANNFPGWDGMNKLDQNLWKASWQ